MTKEEEDYLQHRFGSLLNGPDVELFSHGGCHIFAAALHKRFGYPLFIVPGDGKGVSHVYCRYDGTPPYCVDALGFTREDIRIYDQLVRDYVKPISPEELKDYQTHIRGPGLFSQPWFYESALQRAEKRLETHLAYFDGTLKERVPDAIDFGR